MTPPPVSDDDFLGLLIDALDGDDPVRLHLMVALVMMDSLPITADDRERLRREGPPPVFRM